MGRMVWGDSPSTMSIASERLEKLHANVAITYGTWLFSGWITTLAEHLPPLRPAVESTPWGVWLALILVGMAGNGRLPPLVTEEEIRWSIPKSPRPPRSVKNGAPPSNSDHACA
jgi:hypothetical protein